MAERLAYLEAVIGADITQFRKSMRDIRNDLGILAEQSNKLGNLGRTLTYGLTAPLLVAGASAVKVASDFDGAMRNVNALAQLGEKEFQSLGNEVLAYGAKTRSGAQAVAESLYEVYSAGVSNQQEAMAITRSATLLAESGLSDLTATTNALTATMLIYGDQVDKVTGKQMTASEAADIWARMVQLGVGELDEFLANSQKVLPLNKALGISFQEMGGHLAYLSQVGGGARKAETAYAMMMSNLLKPNTTLLETYTKLGVKTGPELIEMFGGLTGALKALDDEMGDADKFKSFSKTGLEAFLAMTGNVEGWMETVENFDRDLHGATMAAWEEQMKSFPAAVDIAINAVQGLGIAIGNILMPILRPLIVGIGELTYQLATGNSEFLELVVIVGVIAAAIGPLLWIVSMIGTGFGTVAVAAGVLYKAIENNWFGIRDTIAVVVTEIQTKLDPLIKIVGDFWALVQGPQEGEIQKPEWSDFIPEGTPMQAITFDKSYGAWEFMEKAFGQPLSASQVHTLVAKYLPNYDEIMGVITGTTVMLPMDLDVALGEGAGGGVTQEAAMTAGKAYQKALLAYENQEPITLMSRIVGAFETVRPQLEEELSKAWTSVTAWFGEKATEGLNLLASIFKTDGPSTGGGKLTNIIREILSADISGAIATLLEDGAIKSQIDNFFSNLFSGGTESVVVTDFGAPVTIEVAQANPILEAFKGLIQNVIWWLGDEGVTTLTYAVGYLVGRVGIAFGQLVQGLGSMLFGAVTGGDGNNVGGELAETAGGMAQAGAEGFKAAFEDAGVDGKFVLDNIITAISGVIGNAAIAAGAWKLATGGIKNGLTAAISVISWSGGKLLGIGRKILFGVGEGVTEEAAKKAGIGSLIKTTLVKAVGGIKWLAAGFLSVAKGIIGAIAGAIGLVPLLLTGLIIGAIAFAVSKDVRDLVGNAITALLDAIFGEGFTYDLLVQMGLREPKILEMTPEEREAWLRESKYETEAGLRAAMDAATPVEYGYSVEVNPQLLLGETPKELPTTDEAMAYLQGARGEGWQLDVPYMWVAEPTEEDAKTFGYNLYPDAEKIKAAADEKLAIIGEILAGDSGNFMQAAVAELTTSGADGEDVLDAETLISTFLLPLEQAWLGLFGEAGTVQLALTQFSANAVTALDNVGTAMTILTLKALATGFTLNAIVAGNIRSIILPMDEAAEAVKRLYHQLTMLMALDPTLGVQVQVTASTGFDFNTASSHKKGMPEVPYDNYPALLHKGERVLTAKEAQDYAQPQKEALMGNISSSSTTTNNNQQISISGVSVDQLLRELERRGIKLDGR